MSAGLPFEVPENPEQARAFWQEDAPESLMRALELLPNDRWDAVIVDEGQDFRELWWLAVEKLLHGPTGSLWVFYDPNQDIYGGGPTSLLGLQPAALTWNCRNTGRIASYSAALIGTEPRIRKHAPQGVDVDEIECLDDAAMVNAVRRSVSAQRTASSRGRILA
jgi:superfamily I DNA/RNA helicase